MTEPNYDLRHLVAAFLVEVEEYQAFVEAEKQRVRDTGRRLINSSDVVDAAGAVRVWDDQTKETLYEGPDELSGGYHVAAEAGGWFHVDYIKDRSAQYRTSKGVRGVPDDVPAELAEAIQEWVWNHHSEAQGFAGQA